MLQKVESDAVQKMVARCRERSIWILTIHDSLVCKEPDRDMVKGIMLQVLKDEHLLVPPPQIGEEELVGAPDITQDVGASEMVKEIDYELYEMYERLHDYWDEKNDCYGKDDDEEEEDNDDFDEDEEEYEYDEYELLYEIWEDKLGLVRL